MVSLKAQRLAILLLSTSPAALARVLPTATVKIRAMQHRAQATFVTMYGLYDDSSYSGPRTTGRPRLAPVGEVYIAMLSSSLANSPATRTVSPTAPNMAPVESLPPLGPGIVLLPPTSNVQAFSTPTDAPNDPNTSSTTAPLTTPSSRVILLASIVGGILLLTLLLFFFLNPRFTGKAGTCFRFTKRVAKRRQDAKAVSSEDEDDANWVSVTGAVFPERSQDKTYASSPEKDKSATAEDIIHAPSAPLSKFSMSSSDYLDTLPPTRRESAATSATSDYGSTNDTITPNSEYMMSMPYPATPPPTRPPRPPTADSPALSDSVYLACSDQPYVIVVPRPLSKMPLELDMTAPDISSKKLLTPSEFIALHGRTAAAANMLMQTQPRANADLDMKPLQKERRVSFHPSPKRDSVHSRTKSAPLLGLVLGRHMSSVYSAGADRRGSDSTAYVSTGESDGGAHGITKKVLKHRRSRSASGWAYPTERGRDLPMKSTKFFSIEAPSLHIR